MQVPAVNRRTKARLWLRYVLRRHEMTGHRVRCPRWVTDTGPDGRTAYCLGAPDRGVWAGWEWRP